ncbi:unnamed protein product, partial [Brachionus calyciflorus]
MFKNILKNSFVIQRFFHSKPETSFLIEFNTLRASPSENKIGEFRAEGIPVQLEYFDSHHFYKRLKYEQSTLPTVLILPSGENSLKDYKYLIGSLITENYRVIALSFPGFGKSKFLKDEHLYKSSQYQKLSIIHDFINYLIPNRKNELDSVIAFRECCHLIPWLECNTSGYYSGHKSIIMVNPARTNNLNIKLSLNESLILKYGKWSIFKWKMLKKIRSENKNLSDNEVLKYFDLLVSWMNINEQFIDKSSNSLIPKLNKMLIFLDENSELYDQSLNKNFEYYFNQMHGFKNFEKYSSDCIKNQEELMRLVSP